MKHIKLYENFLSESASYAEYEKALVNHDWYYQMSDSSRSYAFGEAEIANIKKIYADLDDSDKRKAFSVWAQTYKKKYPDSDYASRMRSVDDFKGY